jgi:2-methylisocitrate lyase-like PEP mutase family enzyme
MHPGVSLRRELQSNARVAPFLGIFDAFSATVAARHSPNLFYSGFGFAASHYGLPDIGYIAWTDMVQAAWRVRQILPDHKLLVDIDDGYVDTEVTCHVVQQLEMMGVAMVMLEDQARPRRCGHLDGKLILPLEQYLEKLERVLTHRGPLCVLARTDASGDEIFRRVEAFSKTDADAILVDGVRSLEVLREVRKWTRKPLLFNQIAGGKSPRASLSELRDAGATLTLYSTPCLFAAQTAMDRALSEIMAADGRLPDASSGVAAGVAECTALLRGNMNRHAPATSPPIGPSRPVSKVSGASSSPPRRRLGEILVFHGAVMPARVVEALTVQKERGGRLGEILVAIHACSQAWVTQALEVQGSALSEL